MGIQVLSPASDRKLTTVARAKARLGIPSADATHDAFLADAILRVSSAFSRLLGRELARQRYRMGVPGFGTKTLALPVRPVEALNAVTLRYGGAAQTGFTIADQECALLTSETPFAWTAEASTDMERTPRPGTERDLYEVEAWAGYVLPGHDGLRRADGTPVTALSVKTAAAAGATALVLDATSIAGKALKSWGLMVEGDSTTVFGIAADAAVTSGELTVTLTTPLAAGLDPGASVWLSPHYLPEAAEDLALDSVVDAFHRRSLAAGVTSLRTPGFSAEFGAMGSSGLPQAIEARLRSLGV